MCTVNLRSLNLPSIILMWLQLLVLTNHTYNHNWSSRRSHNAKGSWIACSMMTLQGPASSGEYVHERYKLQALASSALVQRASYFLIPYTDFDACSRMSSKSHPFADAGWNRINWMKRSWYQDPLPNLLWHPAQLPSLCMALTIPQSNACLE